jgi:hypothetical protein
MTQSSVIRDNDGARYLSILLKTSEIVLEKMEISKNWFFENNEIIVWSIFVVVQNNIFYFPSMGGENLFPYEQTQPEKVWRGDLTRWIDVLLLMELTHTQYKNACYKCACQSNPHTCCWQLEL